MLRGRQQPFAPLGLGGVRLDALSSLYLGLCPLSETLVRYFLARISTPNVMTSDISFHSLTFILNTTYHFVICGRQRAYRPLPAVAEERGTVRDG